MAEYAIKFHPVIRLYKTIIDDVIENSLEFFLEEGVDKTVLSDLKKLWELKLLQSNAVSSFPLNNQLFLMKAHAQFLQMPPSTGFISQSGRYFSQQHTSNTAESIVTWTCSSMHTVASRQARPNSEQKTGSSYKKVVIIQSDGRLSMYVPNQKVVQLGHLTISSDGSALNLPPNISGGAMLHILPPRAVQDEDHAKNDSQRPQPESNPHAPGQAVPPLAPAGTTELQQVAAVTREQCPVKVQSAVEKQGSTSQLAVLEELELAFTGCTSAHKEGCGVMNLSGISDPDYLDSLLEPQLLLELEGCAGQEKVRALGERESEPRVEPWDQVAQFPNGVDHSATAASDTTALGQDSFFLLSSDSENLLQDLQFETSPHFIDPDNRTTHPVIDHESLTTPSHHPEANFQMDFNFEGVRNVADEPTVWVGGAGSNGNSKEEPHGDADKLQFLLQLDGAGDGSEELEDHDRSSSGDSDDVDDLDAKLLEDELIVEEDPLNSGDDVSEQDMSEMFDVDNVVVCQYDKIHRSKNKWKFHFKDGIMNLNGLDYFFSKLAGDAEW